MWPVQVGETWRLQTLRSPYMCPLFELDGVKFDPCRHITLVVDPEHRTTGLSDDCCYMDAEILEVKDVFVTCKVFDSDNPGSYGVIEVLNDDTLVRFYGKK